MNPSSVHSNGLPGIFLYSFESKTKEDVMSKMTLIIILALITVIAFYFYQSNTPAPDIEIKVLSIRNGQVRLGIEAPLGIRIWRDEIWPGPDSGERQQRRPQTWAPTSAEMLQP